jgi:hypothetical protein
MKVMKSVYNFCSFIFQYVSTTCYTDSMIFIIHVYYLSKERVIFVQWQMSNYALENRLLFYKIMIMPDFYYSL